MTVFSHTLEFSARAIRPITKFERINHWRPRVTTLAWWKFVLTYGRTRHCEECSERVGLLSEGVCDDCYEHHFCECGRRLEDSWGQPGDGFCVVCR